MNFVASGPLTAIALNPTNELAVVGGRDVLRVLHLGEEPPRETLNLHLPEAKLSPFAPTDIKWSSPSAGNLVATASTAGIAIYDLGRPAAAKLDRVIAEHTRAVNRVHFHPNDSFLLLSGSQDGTIKMWDLRTRNTARATIDAKSEGVRDVQFNPLGTLELASALENGSVQIWDLRRTSACERRYNAHNGLALTLDWHSNGRLLATGGRDKMIKIWDTTHEARKPIHYIQTISSVAKVVWRPGSPAELASCSLSSDYRIYVWHTERPYIPDITLDRHDNTVSGIVWGLRGDSLFSCSRDHRLLMHDVVRDGYQIRDRLPKTGLSFSAHSDLAMIASPDEKQESEGSKALDSDKSRRARGSQPPGRSAAGVPELRRMVGHVATDRVSSKLFMILARHYTIANENRADSCHTNARVAEHLGLHQTAQSWRLLQTLILMADTAPFQSIQGKELLDETLRFYAEQGNVQFSCTLLLILRKDDGFSVDIGQSAAFVSTWFMAYICWWQHLPVANETSLLTSAPLSLHQLNSTGAVLMFRLHASFLVALYRLSQRQTQ